MKEIPKEIVKILWRWLPDGNEQKTYDFIFPEGIAVKLTIHRHPKMSGFVIRHEETKATLTTYSFYSILPRRHGTSIILWSYSSAGERLSPEGKRRPKEWTVSTEVSPRIADFDAHYLLLNNHQDPVYCRKIAFAEGLEQLCQLVKSAEPFLSNHKLR